MSTIPEQSIETIPNPETGRYYEISLECPEFTCLCPKTGQPDFATITIVYSPANLCVELKSLKLYLWSFRNQGIFHEAAVNKIMDDLIVAVKPRQMKVKGDFYIRGGIHTVISVDYHSQE